MKPKFIKKINLDTVYIHEPNADLWLTQYYSSGWALLVTDSDKDTILVATVNLEQYGLTPQGNNVFIKDWSENEGVLRNLILEGIISEPIRTVQSGYAEAYECKLLISTWNLQTEATALNWLPSLS